MGLFCFIVFGCLLFGAAIEAIANSRYKSIDEIKKGDTIEGINGQNYSVNSQEEIDFAKSIPFFIRRVKRW